MPRYFRRLAEQPRMAEALWATIHELRMADLTAAGLAPAAFVGADKHAELQALLAAYETHLAGRRLADSADVYRAALCAGWCPRPLQTVERVMASEAGSRRH